MWIPEHAHRCVQTDAAGDQISTNACLNVSTIVRIPKLVLILNLPIIWNARTIVRRDVVPATT
jgi:hypothetical protein